MNGSWGKEETLGEDPGRGGALRYVLDTHCRTSLRSGSGGLTEGMKRRGGQPFLKLKGGVVTPLPCFLNKGFLCLYSNIVAQICF